jgi:5-formyltetrahydrofolate cyclo-ligase
MLYVHMRDEVRTQDFLAAALGTKRIVVPYCVGDELELFVLESMDELAIGTYGILEPRLDMRALPGRRPRLSEIELIMVPGVAFDRQGGRLGHGKGFYDKLLRRAPPATPLVGVAFECQLFDTIPMLPHDVRMGMVITEAGTYSRPRCSTRDSG